MRATPDVALAPGAIERIPWQKRMVGRLRTRLTYANVMATIAVFLALGGGAYAAIKLPANSVGTKQIKRRAVTPAKLSKATRALLKAQRGATGLPGATGPAGPAGPRGDAGPAGADATLAAKPAARVERTAAQPIPNATSTMVSFDSERFDIQDLHNSAADASRLTAPESGLYEISGGVDWGANATGERQIYLLVNGVTPIARQREPANGASRHAQSLAALFPLVAGDYVQLVASQTSGGPLDVVNFSTTFLAMRWAAPAP